MTSREAAAADAAVAELYDRYPYPAHGIVSSVVARLARSSVERLRARRSGPSGGKLRALDAGCGTGEQALGVARAYPDLEVTGVDYSAASLAFARELAEKTSLSARFERADLSRPLEGVGSFDLIVCVGTLHHLADPEAGLRTLRGVAREGATLLGMVYGAYGKWNLFRARDALELLSGADASRERRLELLAGSELENNRGPAEYLRTLRSRMRFGPDIDLREAAQRVLGGRSRQYQADAYTHPREAAYTWAEVDAMLSRTGWKWTGWPERSGMPDRASQLFSGEARREIERAQRLQQASIYERIVCPASLYFLAEPA